MSLTCFRVTYFFFFFFNDTATTEIYTLSLHDALPICYRQVADALRNAIKRGDYPPGSALPSQPDLARQYNRSEEHTSELQSQSNLVCRLLLEKKKNNVYISVQRRSLVE